MPLPIAGYGQQLVPGAAGGNNNALGLKLLLALLNEQQGSYNEAKQANESRYQDILKLFGDNRQRTLGDLADFGTSLVNDANRSYDDKRTELLTSLADRGLSNSTARIGVETGIKRERDAALNRIKDMLIQDRTQADLGFTDRAAGVMERRDDPYPNGGTSASLLGQLVGALAGGSLGGGGGGSSTGPITPEYRQQQALRTMQRTGQIPQPQVTQPAFNTNGLTQDELQRRRNMLGLYLAESPNNGTYVGDKEKAALSQLLMSGQSQFNPAQVGAALIDRTPRQPIFYNNEWPSYYRTPRDYSAQRTLDRNARTAANNQRQIMHAGNDVFGSLGMLPTPLGGQTANVSYHLANVPAPRPGYGPVSAPLALADAVPYVVQAATPWLNSFRNYLGL